MADLSAFLKTHDDISDLGDWAETENDWSKGEVVPKAATAPKSTRTKLPKASTPSFQPKFAGPPYCVRISSIPLSSSEKEISELLWPTGAINVRFHFSKSKFSGNAFANFDSLEELVKALALDKTKVNGTALKVEEAEVKRAGQGMIASRRPKATEAGPTLVGRKSDRGYKVPVPQSNKGNRKVSSGSSKTPVLPRTRISVENKATAPAVVASQPASKKETAPAKVKVDPFGGARPREVVLEKRSSEVAVTPEVAPLVTILKKSTSAQPEEKKDTVLRKKKSHKSKRKNKKTSNEDSEAVTDRRDSSPSGRGSWSKQGGGNRRRGGSRSKRNSSRKSSNGSADQVDNSSGGSKPNTTTAPDTQKPSTVPQAES